MIIWYMSTILFSNHNKYGIQMCVIIGAHLYNCFLFFLRVIINGRARFQFEKERLEAKIV